MVKEFIELTEIDQFVLNLEKFETKKKTESLRIMLNELSKKALFITSVPFYWFIIFTYILNWQSTSMFIFAVGTSYLTSLFGQGWGLLNWLAR